MAPHTAPVRPHQALILAWTLAVWLVPALSPIHAQGTASDGVYYTRQPGFLIPFQTESADRRIQHVLLHVSEDLGKTYQNVATAGPQDRAFRFQARRDGWYWFTVQTVDAENRHYPPNLSQAQPGLKVCVDTQPPVVVLRPARLTGYAAGVEWDLRDENLDLVTLQVDYRSAGGREWVPLPIQQLAVGQHGWNPPAGGQVEVRLRVRDKAGNAGEGTTSVNAGPARPGMAAGPESVRGNLMMVNKRRIALNYKIDDVGPSEVAGVEVWYTNDSGKTWNRYEQEAPRNPPFIVTVAGEGRYGFTLIARSGAGRGELPPRPGDLPQVWVEVDETPPNIRILGVDVGQGAEAGMIAVRWSASDKYLSSAPIAISYAANRDGPWTPVATSLPNTGRHVWHKGDDVPFKFFLKIEATDQAGNVGSDQTPKEVNSDLSIPKARVLTIEPAAGAAPAPESAPH
jgi:hypothetical protein